MLVDDDVAFLHRLADAADSVSRQHFRSEALRTTTKVDGTPVSEVDRAVEEAMLALVRARGTDAVLGEEVGKQPGSSNRQWILDGIDGTHNYADGRPGWGTIIALDVDGNVELGMVSAPIWGGRGVRRMQRTVRSRLPRRNRCDAPPRSRSPTPRPS
jgi:fructose-1,6-bisphosphatase/inositol monophosphatase family enzyme